MMKKHKRNSLKCGLLGVALLLVAGCVGCPGCPAPLPPGAPVPAPGPNRPPVIHFLRAHPPEVQPGHTSAVTVGASDLDGDYLTYSWTKDGGSLSQTESTPSVIWTAPQMLDTYSVTVTVQDNQGGSTSRSINITVITLEIAPLPRDIGLEHWQEVPPE